LILLVTVKYFVDGFLIGISTAINYKAGIILGFANFGNGLSGYGIRFSFGEMYSFGSFCGDVWTSSIDVPFCRFRRSDGSATKAIPAEFIGMVAFGTVALVFLVCNELLIEAQVI
jgi:hypothetical protein